MYNTVIKTSGNHGQKQQNFAVSKYMNKKQCYFRQKIRFWNQKPASKLICRSSNVRLCFMLNYNGKFFIYFPKLCSVHVFFYKQLNFSVRPQLLRQNYNFSLEVARNLLGVIFKFYIISSWHLSLRANFYQFYDVICRHCIASGTRVELKWIHFST